MPKDSLDRKANKPPPPSWLKMDSVWKIVTAAVLGAVVVTIILTTPIYHKIHFRSILIAIACSLPISYLTGKAGLRYRAIVELQQEKLKALNQDIAETNILLQARNAELDAFAHTVAHDLNNQLTGVINAGQLLLAYYSELEPEIIHEQLDVIVRNGFNAFEIIDAMLLLTSAEEESVELKPLDMAELVESALERQRTLIRDRGVKIKVADSWPTVRGYGPWVKSVWSNYISNGIKYGGKPPSLVLGVDAPRNGLARFWVLDNGPGIAPEHLGDLFTRYSQKATDKRPGHGLGLSIVRRIVERLGGKVGVKSAVGEGSMFYFELPLIDETDVLE